VGRSHVYHMEFDGVTNLDIMREKGLIINEAYFELKLKYTATPESVETRYERQGPLCGKPLVCSLIF